MESRNQTRVTEFILLGLTDDPKLKILLFLLFLTIYIITLMGNTGMITLIIVQSCLHTPMYFFLSNLSLSDFSFMTVIAPKMLKDLLAEKKSIAFIGCVAQTYFFVMFGSMEMYMLSVMGYDRYVAICHPLLYHHIMNRSMCRQLVTAAYITGILTAAACTVCTFHASFCGHNVIDHFFCDIPPLMKLSCSDSLIRKVVFFTLVCIFACGSLLITVISYIYIIITILQIQSRAGRLKTFSTCASHLTTLFLFYVSTLFVYLRLPSSGSVTQNKVVSVFYTFVSPMLNPMIYSLRNQEVKNVMRTLTHKKCF